jgi:putative DNA primase/helicase
MKDDLFDFFDRIDAEKRAPRVPAPAAVSISNPEARHKRAAAYLATVPDAVEGEGGSGPTYHAAVSLLRFGLSPGEALAMLLSDYNPRCKPPWSERELQHKVTSAMQRAAELGPFPDSGKRRPNPAGLHAVGTTTPEPEPAEEPEWRSKLLVNRHKSVSNCAANIRIILENDPAFRRNLVRSSFLHNRVVWIGQPPADWGERKHEQPWGPEDASKLQEYVVRTFETSPPSQDAIKWAVEALGGEDYCPVRNYLDSLNWDGVERLDTWLEVYLGATGQKTASMVGRWWMVSAVARAYRPGCQVDTTMVLEGAQGAGKSTALRTLAVRDSWFTDHLSGIDSKDSKQELAGRWIIELGELSAVKSSRDVESVKSFLTRRCDNYRPPYCSDVISGERQCVFAGSTNESEYLADSTGNRRYWPIKVGTCDIAALARDRDQLWAEAVRDFHGGGTWWATTEEESKQLAEVASDRRISDTWEGSVQAYLATHVGGAYIKDLLVEPLGVELAKQGRAEQMRVASILRSLGYSNRKRNPQGYFYSKP